MGSLNLEKLHPLTLNLLKNRGLSSENEIEKFLNPSYERDIGNPFEIYGIKEAVNRIIEAIKNEEKIVIYSDYDCDGIPGGVLLRTVFFDIGYPVEIYIPHRHNEGYGIHKHAIDKLKEEGVTLVITVDSGIANIEEVEYAKSVGVEFIITDHHLPVTKTRDEGLGTRKSNSKNRKDADLKLKTENLKLVQIVPDAVAVINSKQDNCTYHDDMLCGCAVAWKLACALLNKLKKENILENVSKLKDGYEKWLLDLVAISTISDMVPLQKENRALAHFGLKVLRQTKRHGLNYIFNSQRISKSFLTEDDIAFTIAPRINAASRMGDPIQAHNMLYERDVNMAESFALEIEALNTQRKSEVKDIVDNISFDHDVYKNDVVVVGDEKWGPGILGLIAQKIIDETGKPVFVWGKGEGEHMKGSCRSLGNISVVDLMVHVGHDVLISWGGHEGAGGFVVEKEKINLLSDALNESIKHVPRKDLENKKDEIDCELNLNEINEETYKAIEVLSPFGVGNRKPLFIFTKVMPSLIRWLGKKGEHLEVVYRNEKGKDIKAIKFFADKELAEKLKERHDLCAHIEKSYFGGKVELRLRIQHIV